MRTLLVHLAVTAAALLTVAARAQSCGGSPDSCLTVHANPGCSDSECCSSVCALVPECCSVTWDESCRSLADSTCVGLCGVTASGSCTSAHANGGCSDPACCAAVCAQDPVCCDTVWDGTCVIETEFYCTSGPPVECGLPTAGTCTIAHENPGCNNAACCNTVCSLDPSCCTGPWDGFCVEIAINYCNGCSLECPPGAIQEPETCGTRSNDPCAGSGQVAIAMQDGVIRCGTLDGQLSGTTWTGDRDLYALNLTDTDGDGKVRVILHIQSDSPAFAALVPATCPTNLATSPLKVECPTCIETALGACVSPGAYWVVVMPGTAAVPGSPVPITCASPIRYVVQAEILQAGCAPVCSSSTSPCYDIHNQPGCSNQACCQQTCVVDPTCCSFTWDIDCARTAAVACGAPLPANDTCANALPIVIGQTVEFSTIRATTDPLPLPASCDTGTGLLLGSDIWYAYDSERSGNIAVSTCGSTADLRLAVYTGTCAAPTLVVCGSNSVLCSPNFGARVQFTAACSTRYLIRVAGENSQQGGSGRITVTGSGPLCPDQCPSDISRDHVVDGADLGILLGNWRGYGLGDLNIDGTVNGADLGILLGDWGQCP